ncbi:hypothetical protein FRX31_026423, partial [Thalictrum thalictroides]
MQNFSQKSLASPVRWCYCCCCLPKVTGRLDWTLDDGCSAEASRLMLAGVVASAGRCSCQAWAMVLLAGL